ncbi:plasma serine protease inhibitor-like isoform X1 [Eleutherodactylus coqui]|uniref:plasma serine protease inhibitor-like isoform X1 n=1 Tax=Eleutherodactylus coqui TaxID=57060 RepID=UPI003461AEE8
MRILLFLCVGASLVHLGVQDYSFMTVTIPKNMPPKNPNDYSLLAVGVNLDKLNSVYENLEETDSTPPPADAVTIFLSTLKSPANEKTIVISTDFNNPTDAKTKLNNYVTQHTSGKIKNFFSDFEQTTEAVILSCADKWKIPVSGGNSYMVQLTGEYNTMTNKEIGFTMIEIPKNQFMTLLYIIPDEGKLASVRAAANKMNLALWKNSMTRQVVNLTVFRATLYVCGTMIADVTEVDDHQLIKYKQSSKISVTYP